MADAAPERGAKSKAVREYLAKDPDASPKVVVAALKGEGMEVTEGLVSNIKYGGGKPKAAGKRGRKATKGKKAAKAAGGAPQRGTRSQAVRDYLATDPNASPKQVVEALKGQGLDVSEGLVSVIKYKKAGPKAPKGTKRRGRPPAAAKAAPAAAAAAPAAGGRVGGGLSAQDLVDAKKLVKQLGGLGKARKALDTLEELM